MGAYSIVEFVMLSGILISFYILWSSTNKKSEKLESTIKRECNVLNAKIGHMNGKLKTILGAIDKPCWYKSVEEDKEGNITFVMHYINPSYEKFFGISSDEYIGKTDYDVWPKDIADGFYDHDAHVLISSKTVEFTESVENKDTGETKQMRFIKVKFIDKEENKRGIFGILI